MDIPINIQLHPAAKDFLFEHFATVGRVFSDVLGQFEVEYMSIALINPKGEMFFLSSHPSIEQNLIEKQLWQEVHKYQNQFKLWSEFLSFRESNRLKNITL
jgi:hypothetical protein